MSGRNEEGKGWSFKTREEWFLEISFTIIFNIILEGEGDPYFIPLYTSEVTKRWGVEEDKFHRWKLH